MVARNSLQIMSLCKDEKSDLNYYSAGSLNQWRAENDYSGSLIFNWEKSTWWQVQPCFTAGRQVSPWLFPSQREAGVLRSEVGFSVGQGKQADRLACTRHGAAQEDTSLRNPTFCHPQVLLLSWPVPSGEAEYRQIQTLRVNAKLLSSLMPSTRMAPGAMTAAAFPPGTAWMLHLCPGRPTSQDERIIHSL